MRDAPFAPFTPSPSARRNRNDPLLLRARAGIVSNSNGAELCEPSLSSSSERQNGVGLSKVQVQVQDTSAEAGGLYLVRIVRLFHQKCPHALHGMDAKVGLALASSSSLLLNLSRRNIACFLLVFGLQREFLDFRPSPPQYSLSSTSSQLSKCPRKPILIVCLLFLTRLHYSD